jgi:hypothetical protein
MNSPAIMDRRTLSPVACEPFPSCVSELNTSRQDKAWSPILPCNLPGRRCVLIGKIARGAWPRGEPFQGQGGRAGVLVELSPPEAGTQQLLRLKGSHRRVR